MILLVQSTDNHDQTSLVSSFEYDSACPINWQQESMNFLRVFRSCPHHTARSELYRKANGKIISLHSLITPSSTIIIIWNYPSCLQHCHLYNFFNVLHFKLQSHITFSYWNFTSLKFFLQFFLYTHINGPPFFFSFYSQKPHSPYIYSMASPVTIISTCRIRALALPMEELFMNKVSSPWLLK